MISLLLYSIVEIESAEDTEQQIEYNKKRVQSNIWYFAFGSSLLVFATFASFLIYCNYIHLNIESKVQSINLLSCFIISALKRKTTLTDLSGIDNVMGIDKYLPNVIKPPEMVQKNVSETSSECEKSSNESIVNDSLSSVTESFSNFDLTRNQSPASDPTHDKSMKKINFQRSQTIGMC